MILQAKVAPFIHRFVGTSGVGGCPVHAAIGV
jgi:hypothetical protein